MTTKAVKISVITTVARQENTCSTLLTSVCYTKWPATFVGGVSYGKSRFNKEALQSRANRRIFFAGDSRRRWQRAEIHIAAGKLALLDGVCFTRDYGVDRNKNRNECLLGLRRGCFHAAAV